MRPWECSQTDTHRLTDANRFYNLSHAICYSYGADNNYMHDRIRYKHFHGVRPGTEQPCWQSHPSHSCHLPRCPATVVSPAAPTCQLHTKQATKLHTYKSWCQSQNTFTFAILPTQTRLGNRSFAVSSQRVFEKWQGSKSKSKHLLSSSLYLVTNNNRQYKEIK